MFYSYFLLNLHLCFQHFFSLIGAFCHTSVLFLLHVESFFFTQIYKQYYTVIVPTHFSLSS